MVLQPDRVLQQSRESQNPGRYSFACWYVAARIDRKAPKVVRDCWAIHFSSRDESQILEVTVYESMTSFGLNRLCSSYTLLKNYMLPSPDSIEPTKLIATLIRPPPQSTTTAEDLPRSCPAPPHGSHNQAFKGRGSLVAFALCRIEYVKTWVLT